MTSVRRGKRTSGVEVTNVSRRGFWLLLDDREIFVPFEEFPWFRDAAIGQILEVERPNSEHIYWPALDIDLALDSLEHPERYPLISRLPRVIDAPSGGAAVVRERARPHGASRRRPTR